MGSLLRLNVASAAPEISSEVGYLQSSLDDLQSRANMTDVRADVTNLDANLNHALNLLESARDKKFMYQADLEDIAYDAMSRWQAIREDVEANIERQASLSNRTLQPVGNSIQRLNSVLSNASRAQNVLGSVQAEVQSALNAIGDAESTIEGSYQDIESKTYQLTSRLTQIHWAITQRDEASFEFIKDEDLFMAVKARWDQEGKDDPEGVLFLTNKRLIFERKEKIATKKVLFVTTSSELVQEVMGSKPLNEVKDIKAQSKGLFGHQDFLEVDFGGQKIPFHLDGQNSEEWAVWIKDAKSGKIEDQRATGTGLSFADLTGELTQADILDLQNEINELQEEMMLKTTQDDLSEIENKTASLARELADLRGRSYLVEKSLEADIEILSMQWEKIKQRAHATLEYQTKFLGEQMGSIQESMAKLAGMAGSLSAARPYYIQLKSAIASAEAQAEAAEDTVLDQYDEYANEIEMLDNHLDWVDWMLDALSTASFQLLATESGVAAVEAVWARPGLDPENGVLFLTDQRLLWEDRVGDFEVKIEVPVSEITDVTETAVEVSGDESLEFVFGANAPMPKARLLLSQPVAEEWQKMVGQARSGGYEVDRAVEIDQEELDRIRNAPAQCSNCGAAFTAPILRGQKEITCEFCGVNTRI